MHSTIGKFTDHPKKTLEELSHAGMNPHTKLFSRSLLLSLLTVLLFPVSECVDC